MEISNTIKLIADLGFTIVAAGLFVVVAYRLFNKQSKLLEKLLEEKFTQGVRPHHPSSDDVKALDIVNSKIYQELRGVLNALSADRSYIFLYHNGGVSSSGLYFQKMSCICEVVSQGILPVANEKQNLYRASFSYLCELLKNEGSVSIDNYKLLEGQDNFLYQEFVSRHAASAYFQVLKNSSDDPIGFIGIDYCSSVDHAGKQEIKKLLKTVGLKITALVDIRDEVE